MPWPIMPVCGPYRKDGPKRCTPLWPGTEKPVVEVSRRPISPPIWPQGPFSRPRWHQGTKAAEKMPYRANMAVLGRLEQPFGAVKVRVFQSFVQVHAGIRLQVHAEGPQARRLDQSSAGPPARAGSHTDRIAMKESCIRLSFDKQNSYGLSIRSRRTFRTFRAGHPTDTEAVQPLQVAASPFKLKLPVTWPPVQVKSFVTSVMPLMQEQELSSPPKYR